MINGSKQLMTLFEISKVIKKTGVVAALILSATAFIFTADSSASSGVSNVLYLDSVDTAIKKPGVLVSVTLKGMKNSHIPESSFNLKEDGLPVEKFVLKKENFPGGLIYLIISIDASKSISPKELSNYKKSAKGILDAADNSFRIGVWKFNDEVVILKDFTGKQDELSRLVDSISRQGKNTKLYDAIYDGIERLSSEEGSGKSLIVFTDGKDEGSGMTADDVVSFAVEKRIAVHFITIKSAKNSSIERISKRTGGAVNYAGNTDYSGKIVRQLKEYGDAKYTLEYLGKKSENRNRKLEILFKNENSSGRAAVTVQYPESALVKDRMTYVLFGVSAFAALLLLAVLYLFLKMRNLKSAPVVQKKKECPVSRELFSANAVRDAEEDSDLFCRGWLLEKDGPETGKKYPLYWKNITIGRDPSNGIVINDIAISAKHVRIRGVRGSFYLVDLASENGTYLNGRKLLRVKKLSDWDEIKIGRTVFIFRTLGGRV